MERKATFVGASIVWVFIFIAIIVCYLTLHNHRELQKRYNKLLNVASSIQVFNEVEDFSNKTMEQMEQKPGPIRYIKLPCDIDVDALVAQELQKELDSVNYYCSSAGMTCEPCPPCVHQADRQSVPLAQKPRSWFLGAGLGAHGVAYTMFGHQGDLLGLQIGLMRAENKTGAHVGAFCKF